MFVKKTKHLDLLAVYKTINTREHSDRSQHLLKLWPVMISITSFIWLLLLLFHIGRFLTLYEPGRQSMPRIQVGSKFQHEGLRKWNKQRGERSLWSHLVRILHRWVPPLILTEVLLLIQELSDVFTAYSWIVISWSNTKKMKSRMSSSWPSEATLQNWILLGFLPKGHRCICQPQTTPDPWSHKGSLCTE